MDEIKKTIRLLIHNWSNVFPWNISNGMAVTTINPKTNRMVVVMDIIS